MSRRDDLGPERARALLSATVWRGHRDWEGPAHAFTGREYALCGAYPHPRDETRRGRRCGTCWRLYDQMKEEAA